MMRAWIEEVSALRMRRARQLIVMFNRRWPEMNNQRRTRLLWAERVLGRRIDSFTRLTGGEARQLWWLMATEEEKMARTIEVHYENGYLYWKGATFPVQDTLKKNGYRWDGQKSHYWGKPVRWRETIEEIEVTGIKCELGEMPPEDGGREATPREDRQTIFDDTDFQLKCYEALASFAAMCQEVRAYCARANAAGRGDEQPLL